MLTFSVLWYLLFCSEMVLQLLDSCSDQVKGEAEHFTLHLHKTLLCSVFSEEPETKTDPRIETVMTIWDQFKQR